MPKTGTMCDRCDGLCCQVYDIFDTESDKLIKRAGQRCGHLDGKYRCRIYETIPKHAGFRDSCKQYDCLEGGPIVTIFARRIPDDYPMKYAIISSLLETIRIRISECPDDQEHILDLIANLLMRIPIDEKLALSVKVARAKIGIGI